MQSMEKKLYWMGFNLVRGIGAVRLQTLLDHFGDLEIAWQAPSDALLSAGLSPRIVIDLERIRRDVDLGKVWEQAQKKGIRVIIWEDTEYPSILKEIEQPPPVLFVRGSFTEEDNVAVAVVGTRQVSTYGRRVADELGVMLAHNKVTLVSGMARGVDAVAHAAALKAGGRTIAVLGCGVDVIYPPEHQHLAEQIIEQGALVSDYAPGTQPEAGNFPPRNRIISGLSLATVIVEAGEKSGALITATFAAEQGREVLAVPGYIYAAQSKGTNRLIYQGARPMLSPADVLDAINLEQERQQHQARIIFPTDDTEIQILNVMGDQNLHVDEIGNLTGLPIEKVSATLTMMELKGMVLQAGGMNYMAIRESSPDYFTDLDG
jgi:DNA processing protein